METKNENNECGKNIGLVGLLACLFHKTIKQVLESKNKPVAIIIALGMSFAILIFSTSAAYSIYSYGDRFKIYLHSYFICMASIFLTKTQNYYTILA